MENITLTMKEQNRVEAIGRVFRGEMDMACSALVLQEEIASVVTLSRNDYEEKI